jgi:hypothetical protein
MDKGTISQQPYLTFFEDDTAEYDVIVDQSSSAPNLKEATWGAIQPLLPIVGPTMGPEEMALVLEYSPMPESFLEKFKALQDEKAKQPPPPDPEVLKIDAMKQVKAAELQMRQQEAGVEMQLEQQKTAAQLDLERQKVTAQIQLEREKAMLEREKMAMQMQMDRERMAFDQERQKADTAIKHRALKHELVLKTGLAKVGMKKDAEMGSEDSEMDDDLDLFGNKGVADAMAQLAQAMTQMAQANMESQRMMAEGIAALGAELKDAMTKPKQIVRGPDGRAIGVQ